MKTLQQWARDAETVQDACNLEGVTRALVRWLEDYEQLVGFTSTTNKNRHPITAAFVDKLASLAGVQGAGGKALDAHADVARLAKS